MDRGNRNARFRLWRGDDDVAGLVESKAQDVKAAGDI